MRRKIVSFTAFPKSLRVMTIIILLFVLGIVLLALDLFMPGMIMTMLGILVMLAGSTQAFQLYGIGGGLTAFGIGLVLLTITLYIEYVILPKTPYGKKFFLNASVGGASQPPPDAVTLTGRECVAVTPLVPTGQIELDGRRYEALSLDGHIDKGGRLKITGSQNFSLTVTKL